jgi:Uma2 family endonuclease
MSQDAVQSGADWTAGKVFTCLGDLPLGRLRLDRQLGTATEADVIELHDREDRLYELADGLLLEKAVGNYESYLAGLLLSRITLYLDSHPLGVVLPPDGMLRLAPGLVRIPDVSFITWDRLPGRAFPNDPIWGLAPDLAAEVISAGNTRQEMERKLRDYFQAGVRLVWYAYPREKEVRVFTAVNQHSVVREHEQLDGSPVLPGFQLDLRTFFTKPSPSGQ